MATGEGPMIDGNSEMHALIVDRTRSPNDVLDDTDEEEIEE